MLAGGCPVRRTGSTLLLGCWRGRERRPLIQSSVLELHSLWWPRVGVRCLLGIPALALCTLARGEALVSLAVCALARGEVL
eukprot:3907483-Heterocapsa_arctica.AAC.1